MIKSRFLLFFVLLAMFCLGSVNIFSNFENKQFEKDLEVAGKAYLKTLKELPVDSVREFLNYAEDLEISNFFKGLHKKHLKYQHYVALERLDHKKKKKIQEYFNKKLIGPRDKLISEKVESFVDSIIDEFVDEWQELLYEAKELKKMRIRSKVIIERIQRIKNKIRSLKRTTDMVRRDLELYFLEQDKYSFKKPILKKAKWFIEKKSLNFYQETKKIIEDL